MIATIIFIIELVAAVAGQLLLKRAMEGSKIHGANRRPPVLPLFIASIASLAVSFFLMIALLQHFDLSFFWPIQGSTVMMITVAAVFILREKVSARLLIGSLLITAGIVLVSLS